MIALYYVGRAFLHRNRWLVGPLYEEERFGTLSASWDWDAVEAALHQGETVVLHPLPTDKAEALWRRVRYCAA